MSDGYASAQQAYDDRQPRDDHRSPNLVNCEVCDESGEAPYCATHEGGAVTAADYIDGIHDGFCVYGDEDADKACSIDMAECTVCGGAQVYEVDPDGRRAKQ